MNTFDVLDPNTNILGHHLLEASAGTGKTFAIEHITTRLIETHNINIDEILVVTFTKAATRELKMRIYKTLMKNRASFNIQRALSCIDHAHIFTIHGFCHRMLTEFAFESMLPFYIEHDESIDHQIIIRNHLEDFLRTHLLPETYSNAQLLALGKNKSELIDALLPFIDKDGELPSHLTFDESYRAYCQLRPTRPCPVHLFHEFGKIKNRQGSFKTPFNEQILFLEKETLTIQEFEHLTAHPSILQFVTTDNQIKRSNADISPLLDYVTIMLPILEPAASSLSTLIRMGKEARSFIKQRLLDAHTLTPNDILTTMHQCLQSSEAFKIHVQKRYQAAIIDEFQDTDPLQWDIFKTLFIDTPIQTLYLVGDPKQSIYSFRSADIHTYLQAKTLIPNHASLHTNYRSDPLLIQQLNTLFLSNPNFLSMPNAPLPFTPVQSAKPSNYAFPDDKNPVHFFTYRTEHANTKHWPSQSIEHTVFFPFITQEILHLTSHGFSFNDCAILVKDRYQSQRLQNYLNSHQIPSQSNTRQSMINSPMFFLIRALLEAVINPSPQTIIHFLSFTSSSDLLQQRHVIANTIATCVQIHTLPEAFRILYRPQSIDTYADYYAICEYLLDYQSRTRASLPMVLDHLLSIQSLDRQPLADAQSVHISTIHMSKGLEYNIVFALGLINRQTHSNKLLRHKKQWKPFNSNDPLCIAALQSQDAEKMRQLYVGLTRAKHRVYIPLLINDKHPSPPALGQASCMELFNPSVKNSTLLSPQYLPPTPLKNYLLKPPAPSIHQPILSATYSYSSLANMHKTPAPSLITGSQDSSDPLPPGAQTGHLIHTLLEAVFRNRHTTLQTLIETHIPSTISHSHIHTMINHILHTPLSPHPFTLNDLSNAYPEVSFIYKDSSHYVKGFIDLIIRYKDQYFIIDWKTNQLPDYSKKSITLSMKTHHYDLQAHIYYVALSRYLKNRPYSIGGVYYLFLRGLPEQGIYFLPKNQLSTPPQSYSI